MAEKAYTISVYVMIPTGDHIDTLEDIKAGIESTCGAYLGKGYLIKTRPGIPAKVSDEL